MGIVGQPNLLQSNDEINRIKSSFAPEEEEKGGSGGVSPNSQYRGLFRQPPQLKNGVIGSRANVPTN
jgi:hypothetical protein